MIPVGGGQGLFRVEAMPARHTKKLYYLADACFPSKRVEVELLYPQTDEDEEADPSGVVLMGTATTNFRTFRSTWDKLYTMRSVR